MRRQLVRSLAVLICLSTIWEVNYPLLQPQSQLAIFSLLGIVICFLTFPAHPMFTDRKALQMLDLVFALLAALCCGYVLVQTEPIFRGLWLDGVALGDRAGVEQPLDFLVGAVGIVIVLEATRRSIGLALPILAAIFIAYAMFGAWLPDWLFPHRGYDWNRIVSTTFLHSQGVFGMALKVMHTYVFLFVIFGGFLEATGATQFIIDLARRAFRKSTGGAAKVSVLSSGLMGSLSGSAVANTAATGTFTIPMMRSSGFEAHIAGGVAAAASSGGALMPPIMGAGAYMMLEIIDPPVTYLEIIRAALLPAILYYISLLLIVHFYAKNAGAAAAASEEVSQGSRSSTMESPGALEGAIFFGALGVLILLLIVGYTPFRAVTLSMVFIFGLGFMSTRTRVGLKSLLKIFEKSARNGVALVAAASCVGAVVGVVTLTGVGTRFASLLMLLAENNLLLALVLIMGASIVLGMGLPSAVCYLLMATIIGPPLSQLGVVPLAAHLFIFYFGMMSMVTPPVALAAFTAASLARAPVMKTALAAFRFSLVGFTLPYVFVARPQLLMLQADGSTAAFLDVVPVFLLALLGVVPLAAGIAGHLFGPLEWAPRSVILLSAVLILYPSGAIGTLSLSLPNIIGVVALVAAGVWNWMSNASQRQP